MGADQYIYPGPLLVERMYISGDDSEVDCPGRLAAHVYIIGTHHGKLSASSIIICIINCKEPYSCYVAHLSKKTE